MKSKLKVLLFSLLLTFSNLSQADEMDQFIREIETYRDTIKKDYKNVITSKHNYSVTKYFALASVDHRALSIGLNALAERDLAAIEVIAKEFELLKLELSKDNSAVDALSAKFFTLLSKAQRHKVSSEKYENDLQILVSSWENYCHEDQIRAIEVFFKPLANFAPAQNVSFLAAPLSPHGFSAGVRFSGDSQMPTFYNQDRPGASEDEEKDWAAGASLLTAIAATICAPTGTSVLCALQASGVIAAIKFTTDLLRFGSDNIDAARKEDKQREIRDEIYQIQVNSIKSLEKESEGQILRVCQSWFPKGQKWPQETLTKTLIEVKALHQSLEEYVKFELAEIRVDYYKYLTEIYFQAVLNSYLTDVKEYYQDRVELNKKSREFASTYAVPLLAKFAESDQLTAKARLQQQIWTEVILGDASFLPEGEFSFIELTKPEAPTFSNIWRQLGPNILSKATQ